MEDKDPINSEEIAQVDASVTTQQRGKGTDAIIEYLLAVSDSILSDEKIEGPSNEEKNAIANMVHLYLQARYEEAAAEADRCVDSNHPEISSFAVMAHSVANVALNKTSVAQQDYQALQIKRSPRRISAFLPSMMFIISLCLSFSIWVGKRLRFHRIIAAIAPKEFGSLCCTPGLTRYIFSRNMHRRWAWLRLR